MDSDTISITGKCEETVRINGFDRLTLEGASATATISQDVVACDSSDPVLTVLRINDSTNIVLRRLAIHGGRGVRINRSTVNTDEDITIEDSRGNGLGVSGGSGVSVGNSASDTANLIQNHGGGRSKRRLRLLPFLPRYHDDSVQSEWRQRRVGKPGQSFTGYG